MNERGHGVFGAKEEQTYLVELSFAGFTNYLHNLIRIVGNVEVLLRCTKYIERALVISVNSRGSIDGCDWLGALSFKQSPMVNRGPLATLENPRPLRR